jgi:hypothetical protein
MEEYQPAFTRDLLEAARRAGMHTALDTSGFLGARADDRLLAATDLVLLDIKAGSEDTYRRLTGGVLAPTLAFAERLADLGTSRGGRTPPARSRRWPTAALRSPTSPGWTCSPATPLGGRSTSGSASPSRSRAPRHLRPTSSSARAPSSPLAACASRRSARAHGGMPCLTSVPGGA